MYHDYATILLKQHANVASERSAANAIRVLDKNVLSLFAPDTRDHVQQLMPGMTRRRLGNRFGLRRPVPSGKTVKYADFIENIRKELNLTDLSEATMYFDAYIQSHLELMTNSSRLEFASTCEGDVLRAYLRAVEKI
jgi:hypothetical protein